jgi:hypothetical protein
MSPGPAIQYAGSSGIDLTLLATLEIPISNVPTVVLPAVSGKTSFVHSMYGWIKAVSSGASNEEIEVDFIDANTGNLLLSVKVECIAGIKVAVNFSAVLDVLMSKTDTSNLDVYTQAAVPADVTLTGSIFAAYAEV